MTESKQSVIGVFDVEVGVIPMPVKRALIGPECIDEIEARFAEISELTLQPAQGMEPVSSCALRGASCFLWIASPDVLAHRGS